MLNGEGTVGTSGGKAKRIAVCIATCDRNKLLQSCLESLQVSISQSAAYDVIVVVVDNNREPSAKVVCDRFQETIDIKYEWESKPGIPFARNRCLDLAVANDADFVAFLDDDERVCPQWLSRLLEAIDRDDVDVVSGAVIQTDGSELVHKRRLADGTVRDRAETDNVVMKKWLAEAMRFDESMGQTGGTDTLFFRQAFEKGAVIRVCSTAIVYEEIEAKRKSIAWKLRRHYRYGVTHVTIERKLEKGVSDAHLFGRAVVLIPLGLVEFVVKLPFGGFVSAAAGVERTMRGLGGLARLLGMQYEEYKR